MLSNNHPQDSIAGLSGTPKTMFVLGLSVGIGTMAVLALVFMMSLMTNGSEGLFAARADNSDAPYAAAADPSAADAAADPTQAAAAAPVPDVTNADHVRGSATAKVTLIEYSDFECPYCSRHLDTINQLLADYPNDIRLVYRHFPLTSLHQYAEMAAEASECAADQGKFWEMHDALFTLASETGLSESGIKGLANSIGLDATTFNNCLDNGEKIDVIAAQYQAGAAAGVSGTPATFVNGMLVEGAVPLSTFVQIVESEGASS